MQQLPIVIGLSPNLSQDDVKTAWSSLTSPKKWKYGQFISDVEHWFKNKYHVNHAVTFNAGRSALLAILKSLDLKQSDEVMLQAFTCVAVPNAISWSGCKPIFVDIDKSLNIDVLDAEKKLTQNTKVIIVQHTFGIPANMVKIMDFCRQHNLILIEDCAHALGATYKGQLLGTFGSAAFFSFGRDKIISSVYGGIAITNNKNIGNKITQYNNNLAYPSFFWIFQQLLHPIITNLTLKLYNKLNLGKIILFLSQKLKLLSMPVYPLEKLGYQPSIFPKKFPNALASLAWNQLNKITRMNQQRQLNAQYYFQKLLSNKIHLPIDDDGAVFLRFNVLVANAQNIRKIAQKIGVVLGNWYSQTIDPKGTDLKKIGYTLGSCEFAEKAAKSSLNLPTYPILSKHQLQQVVDVVNKNL